MPAVNGKAHRPESKKMKVCDVRVCKRERERERKREREAKRARSRERVLSRYANSLPRMSRGYIDVHIHLHDITSIIISVSQSPPKTPTTLLQSHVVEFYWTSLGVPWMSGQTGRCMLHLSRGVHWTFLGVPWTSGHCTIDSSRGVNGTSLAAL